MIGLVFSAPPRPSDSPEEHSHKKRDRRALWVELAFLALIIALLFPVVFSWVRVNLP